MECSRDRLVASGTLPEGSVFLRSYQLSLDVNALNAVTTGGTCNRSAKISGVLVFFIFMPFSGAC